MAETNNNFNLNFKYGISANLKNEKTNNGTIYVTTDERSMYVDLNGERFRLGDVLVYNTLPDLAADHKNWYKNSLAFVAQQNLLAYYNGTEWVNINDTSELASAISQEAATRAAADTALGERIDAEKARAEGVEAGLNTAIQGNATEITNIKTAIGNKSETNKATSIWDAIESLSGNSTTTLGALEAKIDQEITNRGVADTALGERIDGIVDSYETKVDATAKLQAAKDYADAQDAVLKSALEGTATDTKDSATIKGAKIYADSLDTAIRAAFSSADSALDERLQDVEAFFKSVELENDKTVIDTLKEIQDYIKNDETGASNMLAAIEALQRKTALGTHMVEGEDGEEEKEYATVREYVEAIQAAILAASQADATNKANAAQAAAETTAQGYANTAEANAISAASTDATNKANAAEANAIEAASTDATTKADGAKDAAIAAAAADATNKADGALVAAKTYVDNKMTWGTF